MNEPDFSSSREFRRIDRLSVRQKQLAGLGGGLLITWPLAAAVASFALTLYYSNSPLSWLMSIVGGDSDSYWFWAFYWGIERPLTASIVIGASAVGLATAGLASIPVLSIRSFRRLYVQVGMTAAVFVLVAAVVCGVLEWADVSDMPPQSVVILIAASAAFPAVLCTRVFRAVFSYFGGWTFGVQVFHRDPLSIRAIMILTVLVGSELALLQALPLELELAIAIPAAMLLLLLLSAFFLRRHAGTKTWLNFSGSLLFWVLAILPWCLGIEPMDATYLTSLSFFAGLNIGYWFIGCWLCDVGWERIDYLRGS